MALMQPPACPETANAGERAVFAALAGFLDAGWTAWFQTPVPGRSGGSRRALTPLRADFLLLDATGLTVLEVKGWRAASISEAGESTIVFRNGARAPHPLVQAYRYAAAVAGLLRAQPGALRGAVVPVRYAAALPYVRAPDLAAAAWAPALRGPRLLLAETLGPDLPARLAALPPAGPPLTAAQHAALARLFTRLDGRAPSGHAPPLFDV